MPYAGSPASPRARGKCISSGFVAKQEESVRVALEAVGHTIVDRLQLEEWVTLVSEG